jgi:hypothetical protein
VHRQSLVAVCRSAIDLGKQGPSRVRGAFQKNRKHLPSHEHGAASPEIKHRLRRARTPVKQFAVRMYSGRQHMDKKHTKKSRRIPAGYIGSRTAGHSSPWVPALIQLSFTKRRKLCSKSFRTLAKTTKAAMPCKQGRIGENLKNFCIAFHRPPSFCILLRVSAPFRLLKECESRKEKRVLCNGKGAVFFLHF